MLIQPFYAIVAEGPYTFLPVFKYLKKKKKTFPTLFEDVNCASMTTLKDIEAKTPNVRDTPLRQARWRC